MVSKFNFLSGWIWTQFLHPTNQSRLHQEKRDPEAWEQLLWWVFITIILKKNINLLIQVQDEYYNTLRTDVYRLEREFYYPEPISKTGNYYPRYKPILVKNTLIREGFEKHIEKWLNFPLGVLNHPTNPLIEHFICWDKENMWCLHFRSYFVILSANFFLLFVTFPFTTHV